MTTSAAQLWAGSGRINREKITHIDALSIHKKYTDLFHMDEVPEAERQETARQVVEQILPELHAAVASRRATAPA